MEKMGRPAIEYKPDFCETVKELAKTGATVGDICLELDISDDTYYRWQESYPDFKRAVEDAAKWREKWWINFGIENIHIKIFNAKIYNLMMMNICKWNKKTEEKHDITVKTHEERLKDLE